MEVIDNYLQNVLFPRFEQYEMNKDNIERVGLDIKTRLLSLFNNWNNCDNRRALLVTSVEEAHYYQPPEDIEIRCLVVLTIRNSLIEDLASTNEAAKLMGLQKTIIPERDIRKFTSDAIKYFCCIDISTVSKSVIIDNDVYGKLMSSYPLAWGIIKELGKIVFQNKKYSIIDDKTNKSIVKNSKQKSDNLLRNDQYFKENTVVLSGMDPNIDPYLSNVLKAISEGYPIFFTDSFKTITRNPEKLLKIIDYVLANNASIVTCNFYISRDYVSARSELQRPMHSESETIEKLKNKNGLSKTHLKALNYIINNIN
ncbi:hypothetical protein [Paenibacillus sp. SER-28]